MLATGNIRNYQIVVGGLQLLNLPVSYLCLKSGAAPESTVMVAIVISQICLAARLLMLEKMIGLSVKEFISRVYLNVIYVAAAAIVIPLIISFFLPDGILWTLLSVVVSALSAALSILFVGCTAVERNELVGFIRSKISFR